MARNDFTPAPATPSANWGSTIHKLNAAQLEAIKAIMNRRVMGAVANVSGYLAKRVAIITVYPRLGADLLAKFAVPDVVDIPAEQFVAACEFLEAAPVTVEAAQ